ncbi:MAG: hypothetical protein VKO21_11180 [Candidatus Sericytochromatia bacterium]|nr:hypothetical protein [Candidatus Sericytochromatia bacterium]
MNRWSNRLTGLVLVLAMFLGNVAPASAEESQGAVFVPYAFEMVDFTEADPSSDASFLPSKGTLSSARDATTKHLVLVTVRITNLNDLDAGEGRKFEAAEFTLEGVNGGVHRPHPYSRATTRVRAKPGETVQMTMGFYIPAGRYVLVFRDPDIDGKIVEAEIGPPLQVDDDTQTAVLWGVGNFLLAGAMVALPVVAALLRTNSLFR